MGKEQEISNYIFGNQNIIDFAKNMVNDPGVAEMIDDLSGSNAEIDYETHRMLLEKMYDDYSNRRNNALKKGHSKEAGEYGKKARFLAEQINELSSLKGKQPPAHKPSLTPKEMEDAVLNKGKQTTLKRTTTVDPSTRQQNELNKLMGQFKKMADAGINEAFSVVTKAGNTVVGGVTSGGAVIGGAAEGGTAISGGLISGSSTIIGGLITIAFTVGSESIKAEAQEMPKSNQKPRQIDPQMNLYFNYLRQWIVYTANELLKKKGDVQPPKYFKQWKKYGSGFKNQGK